MPFVKVTYPHRRDGKKYEQGDVYHMSSADAAQVVADGKGEIVKLSPKEIQAWAKNVKPAEAKPARRAPAKTETKRADG